VPAVQAPDALQPLASVLDHVRSENSPLETVVGFATNVSVGAGVVLTVTVAERVMLPPVPVHVIEKLLVLVSAPVDWLPEVVFGPGHAPGPDAVQLFAFVDDHARVEDWPDVIVLGLALSDNVGGGTTVTVTDLLAFPPAPEQMSENALVDVIGPVEPVPEVFLGPGHVPAPEAVQPVAFVDDHVIVAASPLATAVGLTLISTVGAGGGGGVPCTETVTVWDALPPSPVQASEKLLVVASAPVDSVPDVPRSPSHAPAAEHDLASLADHVSIDEPP
jgi:hypothetical protein